MSFKIRNLEIIPFENKFLIRDSLGISKEMILNRESFILFSMIDGEEKIEDIKSKFLRNTGIILSDFEIINFIKEMDKNYVFLNENFFKKIEEEKIKMMEMPFKEIKFSFDFEKIKNEIDKIEFNFSYDIKGMIVPHIDINVAFDTYLKSYSYLKKLNKRIFLILGVPHFYSENILSIFPKNYKFLDKIIKVEEEIIKNFKNKFELDIFKDIIAFKNEHSIEFPIIFLSLIKENFYIIPCLVSRSEKENLKKIANIIFECINLFKEEIFLISSVDLSHVGKKFGDENSFDTTEIDLKYIEYLKNLENENAFDFIEKNKNFTKIDGVYTNFLFIEILKLFRIEKGEIVDYKKYYESFTDSIVSYATLIFK